MVLEMSRKAGKHNSSSVSKPQKGKKGKKNMSYSDISEDEVDKCKRQVLYPVCLIYPS